LYLVNVNSTVTLLSELIQIMELHIMKFPPEVWGKLHNEELHDLYSSPAVVQVIKSRTMSWAGHVVRMERAEACTGFW
jgi:hypothetical protein